MTPKYTATKVDKYDSDVYEQDSPEVYIKEPGYYEIEETVPEYDAQLFKRFLFFIFGLVVGCTIGMLTMLS